MAERNWRLPDDLAARMDKAANDLGISKSHFARLALAEKLDRLAVFEGIVVAVEPIAATVQRLNLRLDKLTDAAQTAVAQNAMLTRLFLRYFDEPFWGAANLDTVDEVVDERYGLFEKAVAKQFDSAKAKTQTNGRS